MMLAPGLVLDGRYRLERRIGEGGMGVVWAAHDVTTGSECALKLIKESASDPDARRRFVLEGRAASAVRHPNVVQVREVLELDDGAPVIVMELLDGESLRDLLAREGRIALGPLLDILVPVISAAGAAHALGVVHRDLKPENIFLSRTADGERVVKVLDFGIAKLTALDGEAARSTGVTTGAVLGTPAYMAPEQVFGERDIDHRADSWALGIVLYQCLTGVLPSQGDHVGQVLKNVLSRPFEPLDQLVDGVPRELAELVARMLTRDRAHRPADLREVFEIVCRHASVSAPEFGPPAATSRTAHDLAALRDTEPAIRRAARQPPRRPVAPEVTPTRRMPRALGAIAAVAMFGAGLSLWRWRSPELAQPQALAASPLAPATARLACPILRASGIPEPAGWLGAAAAAIVCERARVLLGGHTERALVPAELLDLPRGPSDRFPPDPYGQPGARERTVTAAHQRAQAYVDGEVTWSSVGFTVALVLRRSDGGELGSASGTGPGLYEAVRSAMTGLVGVDRIPKASSLAPEVARWARTADVDDALGALDLSFAIANNAGGLPAECRGFEARSARVRELGPEGRWLCAMTLGQPLPAIRLDASDRDEASIATRMRIDHALHPADVTGSAQLTDLRALFQREPTARGKSLVAAIESCHLGSSDPQGAREWALRAVQSEPTNPEGGLCNPWEQLTTLARDTMGGDAAVRAMQAWQPWNSYAWLLPGFRSGGSELTALRLLRRARVLSPLDAYLADTLVSSLLASGEREEARGIAAELRKGGLRLHDVESELILVRVEASEARFGEALARARKASVLAPGDEGWIRVQRFELSWNALELAVLLGRAREVADDLIERFLAPETPVLESNFTAVPMRLPAICALSSAPTPCLARFRSLRAQLPGAITQDTDDFLAGAEHYVKKDYPGAARAWRPLLGGRAALDLTLPDALVDAFERTGADELADKVDQAAMQRAGELHGATLGHVRAARRAYAKGDRDVARRLAETVIDAWGIAADPPPALAEMQALVKRLSHR